MLYANVRWTVTLITLLLPLHYSRDYTDTAWAGGTIVDATRPQASLGYRLGQCLGQTSRKLQVSSPE